MRGAETSVEVSSDRLRRFCLSFFREAGRGEGGWSVAGGLQGDHHSYTGINKAGHTDV